MKLLKNKNGFTLIELLAVIVVLAIIMLIATTQVLPLIEDSRIGGFTSTANTIVSTVETVVLADEIKGQSINSNVCYTIKYLYDEGYLGKITGVAVDDEATSGYAGYVTVTKSAEGSTTSTYVYTISLIDYSTSYRVYNYNYSSNGLLDSEASEFKQSAITGESFTCPTGDGYDIVGD